MIQKFIQAFVVTNVLFVAAFSNTVIASEQNRLPSIDDISNISHCKFLHDISAKSGYSKHDHWQRHATHKALLKAGEFGATHFVIRHIQRIGIYNGVVNGKAYQC